VDSTYLSQLVHTLHTLCEGGGRGDPNQQEGNATSYTPMAGLAMEETNERGGLGKQRYVWVSFTEARCRHRDSNSTPGDPSLHQTRWDTHACNSAGRTVGNPIQKRQDTEGSGEVPAEASNPGDSMPRILHKREQLPYQPRSEGTRTLLPWTSVSTNPERLYPSRHCSNSSDGSFHCKRVRADAWACERLP